MTYRSERSDPLCCRPIECCRVCGDDEGLDDASCLCPSCLTRAQQLGTDGDCREAIGCVSCWWGGEDLVDD